MIILYKCNNPDCANHIKKHFRTHKDIAPFLQCGACGTGMLERQLSAPSSKSTQIVDNGVQSRQVEVMNAVVEKEQERLAEKE